MKIFINYLFILVSLLTTISVSSQEIIAHRGASYLAPENTLSAVKLGFELGAEAVEIDVHLTADHRIIVNHDGTTKRTAQGEDFVIKNTNSEVLRKLDVGSWKHEKFENEKMPFLEEVLRVVPKGKTLVIEVKTGPEILPFLQKAIKESGIQERLALISFNKDVVEEGKKIMPGLPVLWLLHTFNQYSREEAIKFARDNKLEGLNVHFDIVNPSFLKDMRNAGLKIYVYTVNDRDIGRILKEVNVDAITTDRPKWLREGL